MVVFSTVDTGDISSGDIWTDESHWRPASPITHKEHRSFFHEVGTDMCSRTIYRMKTFKGLFFGGISYSLINYGGVPQSGSD